MNCKRCGKALGNNKAVCPFCGTMMTEEQLEIYKENKKETKFNTELISEKYGQTPYKYGTENSNNKINYLPIIIGGIVLIILLIVLTIIL